MSTRSSEIHQSHRFYHTFRAKSYGSENLENFIVRELPDDRVEDAIKFMVINFLPEEPLCQAIELCERTEAINEIAQLWRNVAKQNCSIVCFCEDNDDIVAINFHVLNVKSRPQSEFKVNEFSRGKFPKFHIYSSDIKFLNFLSLLQCIDEAWKNVYQVLNSADLDIFEMFNVESYLSAVGLCVDKKYRSRGIATEMLRARINLLKYLNLTVTASTFTSSGAQKAATNAGYREIYSESYENINKKFTKFNFTNVSSKFFKISAFDLKLQVQT